MSAQVSYFKLGLFVVVSAGLLCAGVIVLGAGELFARKLVVETYMAESVNGIGRGSAVQYLGVDLGQVSDVFIAARKYDPGVLESGRFGGTVLVELAIRPEAIGDPGEEVFAAWLERAVAAGLRVRTASTGFTGPSYIELVYLDPAEFPEIEVAWTPPPLYIPSAPSTMQSLLSNAERILRKLESNDLPGISSDLDKLLVTAKRKLDDLDVSSLNTQAIGFMADLRAKVSEIDAKTLNDEAAAFLTEIRATNSRLKQILDSPAIDPGIEDLRATLQSAKDASSRFNEILHDPKVDRILTELDDAGGQIRPALDDFRRAVRRIDLLIASQQASLESVLTELDRALANISTITEDATQNPSRLLFGDPPPRTNPGN